MDRSEDLRRRILELVEQYAREEHAPKPFVPGRDFVNYGGRVFGAEELRGATEAVLDFFLTAGRFAERFVQHLPCRADEGPSLQILLIAGLFTDQHDPRRRRDREATVHLARRQRAERPERCPGRPAGPQSNRTRPDREWAMTSVAA